MSTRAREPGTNPIPDGQYRVVTDEGDYFVTVKGSSVAIDSAIGLDGESTDWNQEDYARIYGMIRFRVAWIPLEVGGVFAGAVQVDHLTNEQVDQVLGIFEKGEG